MFGARAYSTMKLKEKVNKMVLVFGLRSLSDSLDSFKDLRPKTKDQAQSPKTVLAFSVISNYGKTRIH